MPESLDGFSDSPCSFAIFTDTAWNSRSQVEQQSSRPHGPTPPTSLASSRAPICFISIRVWRLCARSRTSSRKVDAARRRRSRRPLCWRRTDTRRGRASSGAGARGCARGRAAARRARAAWLCSSRARSRASALRSTFCSRSPSPDAERRAPRGARRCRAPGRDRSRRRRGRRVADRRAGVEIVDLAGAAGKCTPTTCVCGAVVVEASMAAVTKAGAASGSGRDCGSRSDEAPHRSIRRFEIAKIAGDVGVAVAAARSAFCRPASDPSTARRSASRYHDAIIVSTGPRSFSSAPSFCAKAASRLNSAPRDAASRARSSRSPSS